jgi:hypothetical protein
VIFRAGGVCTGNRNVYERSVDCDLNALPSALEGHNRRYYARGFPERFIHGVSQLQQHVRLTLVHIVPFVYSEALQGPFDGGARAGQELNSLNRFGTDDPPFGEDHGFWLWAVRAKTILMSTLEQTRRGQNA